MTDDQFRQLLEDNNNRLLERIRADMRDVVDERLDERLERNNAVLFGQLAQYFDKRFDAQHAELKADFNRILNSVDGLAQRLTTDEQERAAFNAEQERQNGWIAQLAEATNTKLVPDQ